MKKIFYLIFLSFLLFSCAEKEGKDNAEIAYTKAVALLKEKNFISAAEAFEKIDDDFPFSKWAIKAQTMAVYAHYKEENYNKLLTNVDDFLHLNPSSEYVPYMIYMKGLSYYNQIPPISRAQDNSQQASFIFRELIARFPNSDYSSDAEEKLSFIDEHLAGAKMSVARYQIKNHNYIGAIQNFKEVINRYRQTNQLPEAYFRLVEIYYKIGLKEEEFKAYNQLKSKFPNDYWTKLAKNIDVNFK